MTVLQRIPFRTSRLLDFFSEKELVAQTGHEKADWPLVALKELVDNALDACEEAGIAPDIRVAVHETFVLVKASALRFTQGRPKEFASSPGVRRRNRAVRVLGAACCTTHKSFTNTSPAA